MLTDNQAISDTLTGLLHAIDVRDWTAVRAALAAQVRTDYTSLLGDSIQTRPAHELVQSWQGFLSGFEATQHQTGPVLADVSGDAARARCAITAVHRLGRDHWTLSGHYELELTRAGDGWVIAAITYRHVLMTGDATLPQQAQARAMRT